MTSKNLQELSELLDSENLAYRKCCNYVSECKDPTLKTSWASTPTTIESDSRRCLAILTTTHNKEENIYADQT